MLVVPERALALLAFEQLGFLSLVLSVRNGSGFLGSLQINQLLSDRRLLDSGCRTAAKMSLTTRKQCQGEQGCQCGKE
jgi:hypothetical protein